MKKLLLAVLSILLILGLCACGGDRAEKVQTKQTDQETAVKEDSVEERQKETNSSSSSPNQSGNNYQAYSEAKLAFEGYIIDKSVNEEEVIVQNQFFVFVPELKLMEYMLLPLICFGETLEAEEINVKDIILSVFTGDNGPYTKADLNRIDGDSYNITLETKTGDNISINISYFRKIGVVRLVAERNGEQALLFECAKNKDGYASQYYFEDDIQTSFNEYKKVKTVYRYMFAGNEGSCARFDDADEPPSLIEGVPDEETFIAEATHWLTLKNDEFTGILGGEEI